MTTLTLTNRGPDPAGPLVIATSRLTVTGCDEPLAASGACTLTVAFTPTELGSAAGTFAIAAFPGADPPLFITVTAHVALRGVFTVRPTAIDLGKVVVGVAAPRQTVTVTAVSSLSDLTVATYVTVSLSGGELVITADTCSGTALAPRAACSVFVALKPVSVGFKSATLTISGGSVPAIKSITGTGIAAVY